MLSRRLDKSDTTLLKGIGILLIAFHNFFHWVVPSTGENEFDFFPARILYLFKKIGKDPLEVINLLFSFFGHFGVQIFIFISAYGLVYSYQKNKDRWDRFFVKRSTKIYPAFLSATIILIIIILFKSNAFPGLAFYRSMLYKFLFIHNLIPGEALKINGPWWFYALIVQLYAIFPLIYKIIKKFDWFGFVGILVFCYVLIFLFYKPLLGKEIFLMSTFVGHLPEFALGIFLALKPRPIQYRKFIVIGALILFGLGNFYFFFYPFTFLAVAFLSAVFADKYFPLIRKREGLTRLLMYYGVISMYFYSIHGFLRTPFVKIAAQHNHFFITLSLGVFFVLTATILVQAQLGLHQVGNLLWDKIRILSRPLRLKSLITSKWIQDFARIQLLFMGMLLGTRFYEFSVFGLGFARFFQSLQFDLILVAIFSGLTLLPYFFGQMKFPKTSRVVLYVLIGLVGLINLGLVDYFLVSRVPLDQVVMNYSIKEMIYILGASADFEIGAIIPVFILIAFLVAGIYLTRRISIHQKVAGLLLLASILASVGIKGRDYVPSQKDFDNDELFFLTANKLTYLVTRCSTNRGEATENGALDEQLLLGVLKEARDYHKQSPHHQYVDKLYPFVHKNDYQNILGPHFNLDPANKPNVVFLVVEGLSSVISGDATYFGSYTPFIDSLAKQSLYWPNCLSTSERTFEVLPSLLASAPYGEHGFSWKYDEIPDHQSLMSLLKPAGYYSSFFYGGDPAFNGMEAFMQVNQADFILNNADSTVAANPANPNNNWGFPDHILYQETFKLIDSLKSNQPRLDVLLTLSMHTPFAVPDMEKWEQILDRKYPAEKVRSDRRTLAHKLRKALAAVLYGDYSLEKFFQAYQQRADYQNTIFIITGDHKLGVFPPSSLLDNYRVPLMIYSPMLKGGQRFGSVVSHLDVSPSIYALLQDSYGLQWHSRSAWLGEDLAMEKNFECKRQLPFMRNNRSIVDYISGEHFYSKGRLYAVEDSLAVSRMQDPAISQKLGKQMEAFNQVNLYSYRHNRLISPDMYPESRSENLLLSFSTDFDDQSENKKNHISNKQARSGEYAYYIPESLLYGTVIEEMDLQQDYQAFEIDLKMHYKSNTAMPDSMPVVVFEVKDGDNKMLVWKGLNLNTSHKDFQDTARWYSSKQTVKVNLIEEGFTNGGKAKMYLWNRRKTQLFYDDLEVSVIGIEQ